MTMELDLIVKGGTVVTANDVYRADVGVAGGKIAALGMDLGRAPRIVNAVAKYVLPGAIDVHTHFEMPFIRARRDQGRREERHRGVRLDRVSAVGTVSRSKEISSCSRVLSV